MTWIPLGKDWIDLLSSLLTPTIALLGLYLAWMQDKLNKERFRHETYEKRYPRFEAVRLFIASIVSLGKVKDEERRAFFANTAGSRFLFGPEIQKYLDDLHERSVRLQYLSREVAPERSNPEQDSLLEEKRQLFTWFSEQFTYIEKLYDPYLNVSAK